LQLRLHPNALALKAKLDTDPIGISHDVELHYAVHRGPWYDRSWKGRDVCSGGICVNIGIHFFDLLLWLFGGVIESRVHTREKRRATGTLELQKARVRWIMSMEEQDLLPGLEPSRYLRIDGEELFLPPSELHATAYHEILAGRGLRVSDARPALEAAHAAQHMKLEP
jgi:UDP-N-acetyl-2-amino-2-deoxyglucuronate dehydrogenase